MDSTTDQRTKTARSNRVTLLFLVLVCASPPLLGWIFWLNPEWIPGGSRARGTLIEPPRAIPPVEMTDPAGQPFDWNQLTDRWSIFVFGQGGCDSACTRLLAQVRQIRRALGAPRLRTLSVLVLLPGPDGERTLAAASLEGLDTLQIEADAEAGRALRYTFGIDGSPSAGRLYLVDTRGDLMMTYDLRQQNEKDVVKDLEVLLKASENWHTRQ